MDYHRITVGSFANSFRLRFPYPIRLRFPSEIEDKITPCTFGAQGYRGIGKASPSSLPLCPFAFGGAPKVHRGEITVGNPVTGINLVVHFLYPFTPSPAVPFGDAPKVHRGDRLSPSVKAKGVSAFGLPLAKESKDS